jgi:tetratricopeptide (TPR) repeat protein
MPSLQALREFKLSFDDIGGERAVLKERHIPFEDLPLPELEAELPDTAVRQTSAEALSSLAQMDLDPSVAASLGIPQATPGLSSTTPMPPAGDSGLESPETAALDDFDMGALLGSLPDEIPEVDTGIPENLLNGLADDVEQSPPDTGFEAGSPAPWTGPGGEASGVQTLDVDLDDLEDQDGQEEAGTEIPDEEPADLGEFDEFYLGDLNEGDQDGQEEAGTETPGTDLGDPGELNPDGSLDLNLGEEPDQGGDTQDLVSPDDIDNLDLDFEGGFDETDFNTGEADSFDSFSLEGPPPVPEEEETGADLGDDFTLPGIDDMLGGIPGAPQEPAEDRKSFFGSPKEKEPEEIKLDEADLSNFRRTLAAYPLNLRLAVEEIVAERAVPPDQMADLVRLLVRGALPRETAALAGKILGRTIQIPRGFQKKTGEQLEAERGSLAYVFVHNFLPVFRLSLFIAIVAASSFYLIWRFIYTPIHAENIYRLGYDRIAAGEYERANQRFSQAFSIHRDKNWFYRYAEAFRDQRQYIYAEEKYDELLSYYPRDKKGVLDYAAMETYYLLNYEKADLLLRRNILEFKPNDPEALLSQGDNALAWGEIDPARYEDARFAYARLLEHYGWTDPIAERMLKYFIRTDNLKEVIPLQHFFMDNPKKKISAETLAELGGYLLDKRTEEVRGVPDEYREQISDVRNVLLRAILLGPDLPEAHYHLSRYYRNLGTTRDEELTLGVALRAFDSAGEESARRRVFHIEALKRDAEILAGRREYFQAEERLVKAIGLYQNALERRLLVPAAQFGQLYAAMGDLEYFTKSGDMGMTLNYYQEAEKNGYSSPEMFYRMGAAHYRREEWAPALERFFASSSQLPLNRRLLLALANTCYRRGDFYAAQGYYNRLLDLLEAERSRFPILLPNDSPEYTELAERLMIGQNNLGVTLEALARRDGNPRYLVQAAGLYVQSAQSWDALTRNPQTMIRLGAGEFSSPGTSLAFLNSRNILYPQSGYEPQLFIRIDKDVLEPSPWEE